MVMLVSERLRGRWSLERGETFVSLKPKHMTFRILVVSLELSEACTLHSLSVPRSCASSQSPKQQGWITNKVYYFLLDNQSN